MKTAGYYYFYTLTLSMGNLALYKPQEGSEMISLTFASEGWIISVEWKFHRKSWLSNDKILKKEFDRPNIEFRISDFLCELATLNLDSIAQQYPNIFRSSFNSRINTQVQQHSDCGMYQAINKFYKVRKSY